MGSLTGLRLIQFKAGYNLPVHVGREKGIFERHGLEVEVAYTPGSLFLAEALRRGEFEIGHTGADDVVADVEDFGGGPAGLFLFMGLHSGLMSVVGAPHICTVASLRRKLLAVDARASGFVFILEKFLRSKGLAPDDYRLVEVGGWESRYHALLEGKFAATLLTPPFVGNAVEQGCHVLARGDQIIPCYQATGGAAQHSWAEKNRDLLVRYIGATIEATQWCFDPKNRAQCIELLGKHNDIEGKSAEATLDALLDPAYGIYPKAELNLGGIASVLELRAEMGYLKPPLPTADKYVDLSFYQEAKAVREK
ncbi:MAG TPA: ABC transporter substrate-binding protein [Candidatus Binatia bacterium]|nr:ABC transporter substrate-binding protein [Candidatus Binatia bacterium]